VRAPLNPPKLQDLWAEVAGHIPAALREDLSILRTSLSEALVECEPQRMVSLS
jgi:hypothetical protein